MKAIGYKDSIRAGHRRIQPERVEYLSELRDEGLELSDRERELGLPGRKIFRAVSVVKGFTGAALREMRKRNGVGRPPKSTVAL